jgi:hypothetical protein
MMAALNQRLAQWRAAMASAVSRPFGRDLAGVLAGGSSRDGLPVRLSNRTYAGTRNTAVRELGFDQSLLWVVVALLAQCMATAERVVPLELQTRREHLQHRATQPPWRDARPFGAQPYREPSPERRRCSRHCDCSGPRRPH